MIELFLADVFTGCLIAILIYLTGAAYGLSRHYLSTWTTVPAV